MSDKELLELAAKAAGIPLKQDFKERFDYYMSDRLNMDVVFFYPQCVCVGRSIKQYCDENYEGIPYAATRRAIDRAAAEIGKGMK